MTPEQKMVVKFLTWLRDNDHCEAAWLPEHPKTEKREIIQKDGSVKTEHWPVHTHFRVSGMGKSKTVSLAVQVASRDFVDPSSRIPDRMFYPNEKGLAMIRAEESSDIEIERV